MTIVIGRLGKFWAFADVANAIVATAMAASNLIVIPPIHSSGAGGRPFMTPIFLDSDDD
jgi:hypothetical protein